MIFRLALEQVAGGIVFGFCAYGFITIAWKPTVVWPCRTQIFVSTYV